MNELVKKGTATIFFDIGLALLIYFVSVFLLYFLLDFIQAEKNIALEPISERILDILGLIAATFFLIKRYPYKEKKFVFNKEQITHWFKHGLIPGLIVAILIYPYSLAHKGNVAIPDSLVLHHQNLLPSIIFLSLAIIVSPVVEEYFIRACLFRILKSKIRFFFAALLSSCAFVLLHNISAHSQFVKLFIISLVLTFSYELSGTIRTSISAHIIGNGVWYLAVYSHLY